MRAVNVAVALGPLTSAEESRTLVCKYALSFIIMNQSMEVGILVRMGPPASPAIL